MNISLFPVGLHVCSKYRISNYLRKPSYFNYSAHNYTRYYKEYYFAVVAVRYSKLCYLKRENRGATKIIGNFYREHPCMQKPHLSYKYNESFSRGS
jgi:hypothetical protein